MKLEKHHNLPHREASTRSTQRDRILALLLNAQGEEVPLPQILELKISQFGARIKEIREAGHIVRNRTERRDGRIFSWYRLEPKPTASTRSPQTSVSAPGGRATQTAPIEMFPEFRNLEGRYPD
jgi:hypothetical protein